LRRGIGQGGPVGKGGGQGHEDLGVASSSGLWGKAGPWQGGQGHEDLGVASDRAAGAPAGGTAACPPPRQSPATRLLVDQALLAAPGAGPAPPRPCADEAAFLEAEKSFAFRCFGVPTPLPLRAAPGIAAFAAEHEVDDLSLRFALGELDGTLRAAIGEQAFAGLSLVLTARETLPKLFDGARPLPKRGSQV